MSILEEAQLVRVDPRLIQFNPENTNVHEGLEFEKLVESIREHGIFNPPTVRRLPGGIYQTIAGEGRVKAAIIANFEEIDVLSRGLVDDKTARLFLHIDNAVRNFDLISECVGLAQLYDDGVSTKDLQRQFSKTGHGIQRVQDLIGVGHFSPDIIKMIQDDININNRKDFWNYSILQALLPIRTEVKHHRVTSSDVSQYSYGEVKLAVEKLISGDIKDFNALKVYILRRRNALLQKSMNRRVQAAVQEELQKANDQIALQQQMHIAGLKEEQKKEYEEQLAALKLQMSSIAALNEKLAREITKRPDKIDEKEEELIQASEQLRKQRILFEDFNRKQEIEIERITARIQREQEEKFQRKLDQLEEEFDENRKNLELYYIQKDESRQLKAQTSFQSTVARLTELLASTQQLGLMMLTSGYSQGFEWLTQPEILALSAQIAATSQTEQRIQNKLHAIVNKTDETFERSY